MKNRLFATAVVIPLLGACIETHVDSPTSPANSLWGSGHLVTETRAVSGFHRVLLSGAGELTVAVTGTESLILTAEDNIIDKLTSDVVGDRLVLGLEAGTSIAPTLPILYRVTAHRIEAISVSGAGVVEASGIVSDQFAFELSGADAADVNGRVGHQDLLLSGAGQYDAADLPARTASITISGAGRATIRVSERIEGVISGSGRLDYYGDPEIAVTVSGGGTIRRLGD